METKAVASNQVLTLAAPHIFSPVMARFASGDHTTDAPLTRP